MLSLILISNGKEENFKVTQGERLSDVLKANNVDIIYPCMENGRCGKCTVKVISGNVEPSETDKTKLTQEEIELGIRASCQVYVKEDLTIEVAQKPLY